MPWMCLSKISSVSKNIIKLCFIHFLAPAGDNAIEKNIIMSSIAANVQTRVVVKNRLIILNRLPADLRFWLEVQK